MRPDLNAPIVHHTAIVESGAHLGDNVKIGPYCVIKRWASMGANVVIGSHCVIESGVYIGDNVKIGPHCRIGGRAEIMSKCRDLPIGKVAIGSNTTLTAFVNIDSGSDTPTVIGEDCFIMAFAYIGHDVVIFDGVVISPNAMIGGECVIKDLANIGMGAMIHQQITIPEKCMIGMGAVVTKKRAATMEPLQTWAGNPAKLIGPNKKWLKA